MQILWIPLLLLAVTCCAGKKSPLYGGTGNAVKFDDGPSLGIRNLTILSGWIVDAIQVQTVKGLLPFHGTDSCRGCSSTPGPQRLGGLRYQIKLDYPREYIYKISGYEGISSSASGEYGLTKLYIHVKNGVTGATKIYGSFGTEGGTKFESEEGKIVGFWGFASNTTYLRGIGVYFQDPRPPPPPPPPKPVKSPLYGGSANAVKFDDGPSLGIRNLTILSGNIVDAIQVQTDKGLLPFHGTDSCRGCSPTPGPHRLGGTRYQIKLDYPREYIYKISGYEGWSYPSSATGDYCITKLYVHVKNGVTGAKKIYGPFGKVEGTKFESDEGKIVGFWGFASTTTYLRGIGVYFQSAKSAVDEYGPVGHSST